MQVENRIDTLHWYDILASPNAVFDFFYTCSSTHWKLKLRDIPVTRVSMEGM